ncbi:jg20822 [Pararge aegeria aegeria]|uniref:Jg20822 protein n=1 Tax=Pararge aegeria aegeria TaxID=348720 RepID=A0A8S4R6C9_9NEOP|nr:jg20822 [Pararge aegeria aegeria]
MERAILGVSLRDQIRNEEIRRRTRVTDIAPRVAKLEWKWAGNIARRTDGRCSSKVPRRCRTDKTHKNKIREESNRSTKLRKKLKWEWAGHVVRLSDHRWTKTVTKWRDPPGKRYKGRPSTQWDDGMKKIAGTIDSNSS